MVYWTYEVFADLIALLASDGLRLAAIENFAVKQWSDILLDGPQRDQQMAAMKQMIRDGGRAGVPCFGYNFSIAGVWGWVRGPFARGGAMSVGFDGSKIERTSRFRTEWCGTCAYRENRGGTVPPVSDQELWSRLNRFLTELLPVAEEAGVALRCPSGRSPMDALRGTARLVNKPGKI